MRRALALLALGWLLAAGPARAAEAPSPNPPSDLFLEWFSGWEPAPLFGPGMIAWRDPETGAWGMPPAGLRLGVSLWDGPDRTVTIVQPDGSIISILDPRLAAEYSVARLGPGGVFQIQCGPAEVVAAPGSATALPLE